MVIQNHDEGETNSDLRFEKNLIKERKKENGIRFSKRIIENFMSTYYVTGVW